VPGTIRINHRGAPLPLRAGARIERAG